MKRKVIKWFGKIGITYTCEAMKNFSDRYQRQILLPQIEHDGQQKILNAKILVVGSGGLGCPLLQILAGAGVGHIGIIDGDVVSVTNLHRQFLFQQNDIGKNKSEAAAAKLRLMNADISIEAFPFHLSVSNAINIVQQFDLVIDGSDNFSTRYLVNDVCVKLNLPFISGAVNRFEGQIGLFNQLLKNGNRSATYRCLFPSAPNKAEAPTCNETGILGSTTAAVAAGMAQVCLLFLSQKECPTAAEFLQIDFLSHHINKFALQRNEIEVEKILTRELIAEDELLCDHKSDFLPVKDIDVSMLSVDELKSKYFLIDVREPAEHDQQNIGGLLIPFDDVIRQVNDIPENQPVLLYCKSGVRSFLAIQKLQRKKIFTNLFNLKGGLNYYLSKQKTVIENYE